MRSCGGVGLLRRGLGVVVGVCAGDAVVDRLLLSFWLRWFIGFAAMMPLHLIFRAHEFPLLLLV